MKIAFVLSILIAGATLVQSATMKAIIAHQYGGPEVLKLEDVPVPTPKEDEMLVKVFAAGVNSFDGTLRAGRSQAPRLSIQLFIAARSSAMVACRASTAR